MMNLVLTPPGTSGEIQRTNIVTINAHTIPNPFKACIVNE